MAETSLLNHPKFCSEAAQALNLRTDEVIFLDNEQDFLDAAIKTRMYGAKTILYEDVASHALFKQALEEIW